MTASNSVSIALSTFCPVTALVSKYGNLERTESLEYDCWIENRGKNCTIQKDGGKKNMAARRRWRQEKDGGNKKMAARKRCALTHILLPLAWLVPPKRYDHQIGHTCYHKVPHQVNHNMHVSLTDPTRIEC